MRWNNIISCGLIFYTVFALLLTACTSGPQVMDGEDMVRSYTQVSQESEPEAQMTDTPKESESEAQDTDAPKESKSEAQDTDTPKESEPEAQDTDAPKESGPEAQMTDEEKTDMKLKIADTEVPVTWEENESVDALTALAAEGPLTIQMSMYGGFEQVGPIGQSIASDDQQTTTQAGDIVLYSGDQIVVFYGSNSWAYTRLGHVELSQKEMGDLLGNGDVILTLQIGGSR